MNEILNTLLVALLVVVAGAIGYVVFLLRKYIIQKIGQEKYDLINKIIEDIVRYVEQLGVNIGYTGEDKKAMAVTLCVQALKKLGYDVDPELIDRLIERAVQILNENVFRAYEDKDADG